MGPRTLLAALLAIPCAALVALRRTFDVDVFWHLATGKLALASRSTLPVDPFSFGAAAAPWPYKDLLADIIFYLGFARLGYLWLALLKGAAVLGMGAALWLALGADRERRAHRGLPVWLAGFGLHLLALQYRVSERPILFSLAAYPLLLALCERARRRAAAAAPRELAALFGAPVLLCVLWAQLHREVLVGLVTLLGLFFALLFARLLPGRLAPLFGAGAGPSRPALLAAAAAAPLGAALCLLNPSGAALFRTTLRLSRSAELQGLLNEWKALPLGELLRTFPATVVVCGLGGGALLARLALALRRGERGAPVDLWHLGWWGLFCYLSAGSIRWLPFLAAVSALGLALCLADLQGRGLWPVRAPGRLCALLCVLLLLLLHHTNQYAMGLGELPHHYPEGALAFARAKGLRPRVANAFGFGGYVIWRGWPTFRVLVDGRTEMIYPPAFVRDCAAAQKDPAIFAAMRARDGADWVLAVNRPGQETHLFLARDPRWALVYLSEAAAVYVRAEAYPHLVAQRFRHLVPGALLGSVAAALARGVPRGELEEEIRRFAEASPDGPRAGAALALYLHHSGRRAERDEVARRLRALYPDHAGVRETLRALGLSRRE